VDLELVNNLRDERRECGSLDWCRWQMDGPLPVHKERCLRSLGQPAIPTAPGRRGGGRSGAELIRHPHIRFLARLASVLLTRANDGCIAVAGW